MPSTVRASPPALSLRIHGRQRRSWGPTTCLSFKSVFAHRPLPGKLFSPAPAKSHPSFRLSSNSTWTWHLLWPNPDSPSCLSLTAYIPTGHYLVQATIRLSELFGEEYLGREHGPQIVTDVRLTPNSATYCVALKIILSLSCLILEMGNITPNSLCCCNYRLNEILFSMHLADAWPIILDNKLQLLLNCESVKCRLRPTFCPSFHPGDCHSVGALSECLSNA